MADLSAEEASVRLKQAMSEWWQAFNSGQLEKAAGIATDVAHFARAIKTATFTLYAEQEGKSASSSPESKHNKNPGIPSA